MGLSPERSHWKREHRGLPRVSGRHQKRALARFRRIRAIELRCQGWTNDAIADELGDAHRGMG